MKVTKPVKNKVYGGAEYVLHCDLTNGRSLMGKGRIRLFIPDPPKTEEGKGDENKVSTWEDSVRSMTLDILLFDQLDKGWIASIIQPGDISEEDLADIVDAEGKCNNEKMIDVVYEYLHANRFPFYVEQTWRTKF